MMKIDGFFDKMDKSDILENLKRYIGEHNIAVDNEKCPLFENLLLQKYQDAKHENISKNDTKVRRY